jgi:hypothetical protein
VSGCYVPWKNKSEETALDRNNTNPEEEIFKDSKSVPSDCITGIENRLVPGIIAGSHSGISSLFILPVELEFKIRKCNLLLCLLHFVPWFHVVIKKIKGACDQATKGE